ADYAGLLRPAWRPGALLGPATRPVRRRDRHGDVDDPGHRRGDALGSRCQGRGRIGGTQLDAASRRLPRHRRHGHDSRLRYSQLTPPRRPTPDRLPALLPPRAQRRPRYSRSSAPSPRWPPTATTLRHPPPPSHQALPQGALRKPKCRRQAHPRPQPQRREPEPSVTPTAAPVSTPSTATSPPANSPGTPAAGPTTSPGPTS